MVILVYPGHPFYEKNGIYIRELENEPLIMLGERSFLYYEFQRMCRQCGFEPQIVVKTMESAMTRKLCREHVGIGLDVDFELKETALEGIRKIPIMDHLTWVVQMAYRNDSRNFSNIKEFAAYIEQNM